MKKSKPTVKVYETIGGKFTQADAQKARIEELSPGISTQENDDRALRNHFLKQNPFFYNAQTSPLKVDSIEEFLIKYKRKEIPLADVIHNPNINLKVKKKVVHKAFKEWNKDFINQKQTTIKKTQDMVEVIGGIEYMGFKWYSKLILSIAFVLLATFMNPLSSLWQHWGKSGFGASLQSTILQLFDTVTWIAPAGNAALYLLIILILYSSVHNTILKDYRIQYRFAKGTLKRSQVQIDKEHRKKHKHTRNYYMSRVGKKNRLFPPITMKEIEKRKVGLDYFEEVSDKIVGKASHLKKRRWVYKLSKTALSMLSLAGALAVIGYVLYETVRGIFF